MSNLAVTVLLASMTTEQLPEPAQPPPLHPAKTESALGSADRLTVGNELASVRTTPMLQLTAALRQLRFGPVTDPPPVPVN